MKLNPRHAPINPPAWARNPTQDRDTTLSNKTTMLNFTPILYNKSLNEWLPDILSSGRLSKINVEYCNVTFIGIIGLVILVRSKWLHYFPLSWCKCWIEHPLHCVQFFNIVWNLIPFTKINIQKTQEQTQKQTSMSFWPQVLFHVDIHYRFLPRSGRKFWRKGAKWRVVEVTLVTSSEFGHRQTVAVPWIRLNHKKSADFIEH